MDKNTINPNALKIILLIIGLSSGPIGWIMIVFWFLFNKRTPDNTLESFLNKNPKIFKNVQTFKSKIKNYQPKQNNPNKQIPTINKGKSPIETDANGIIRTIIFILGLIVIIFLIYLLLQ